MITKHKIFDEFVSYLEAAKALEYLEGNRNEPEALPDVILLDLNMPVVDGWLFLERYEIFKKDLSKDIKIYIVSSSVDDKDISRSQSYASVKGFISKPLSPDILRKTMETFPS
jgi:CheY-like chemotaxis protein